MRGPGKKERTEKKGTSRPPEGRLKGGLEMGCSIDEHTMGWGYAGGRGPGGFIHVDRRKKEYSQGNKIQKNGDNWGNNKKLK